MTRLENELRHAMRREEPPEGFVERVLTRAAEKERGSRISIFARPGLRWALAGAMCLALAVTGIEYRKTKVEQARGEAAKTQLMTALRITADKLHLAQERVRQIGKPQAY